MGSIGNSKDEGFEGSLNVTAVGTTKVSRWSPRVSEGLRTSRLRLMLRMMSQMFRDEAEVDV